VKSVIIVLRENPQESVRATAWGFQRIKIKEKIMTSSEYPANVTKLMDLADFLTFEKTADCLLSGDGELAVMTIDFEPDSDLIFGATCQKGQPVKIHFGMCGDPNVCSKPKILPANFNRLQLLEEQEKFLMAISRNIPGRTLPNGVVEINY
jgi:hypothetical protein